MTIIQLVASIESALHLGVSAYAIAQRLCTDYGGQSIPALDTFEAHLAKVRALPDLAPAPDRDDG